MNPNTNNNSNPSLTLNTNNLSPVNHMNNVNTMPQPLNHNINQPFSEYTISGVLHFLQKEWRNFDRERNEWEIERAELKAKIACLEGERRAVDNIRNDLMRRVKMLEYALRQERSRYLNNQPTPEPENNANNTNNTNSTNNENQPNQRPPLNKMPSNYAKHIFKTRSSSSSASSTLTAQKNKQKKEKFKEVIKLCLTELNSLPFTEYNAANSNTSSAGLVDRKFELNWEELDFEPKESSSDPPSRAPPNSESAPTSLRKLYSSENTSQPQYKTMGPSSGSDFSSTSPNNQVSPTNPPMILKKPTPTTTITTDSASPSSDSSKPIPRPAKQDNMSQEEKRNKRITVIAPSDFEGDPYDNANINDSPRSIPAEDLQNSRSKTASNAASKNTTISSGSLAAGKLNSILKALGKSPEDGEELDLDNSGFSNPDATVSGHRSKHENQDLQKLSNLKDDQFIFDDDKDTEPAANLNLKVEDSNQLWKPKLTLKSHLDTVRTLDFHDQDLVLCTGSDDGTIKVWDLHNLTINSKKASRMEYDPILVARGHEGPITSVLCSSSQSKIYSSSFDCTIRVWEAPNFPTGTQMDNPEKANLITKFEGHTDVVWNIKLNTKLSTGDKILLASAGADETVRLWDTENLTNPLLRTFKSSYPDINPTAIDFNHIDNSKLFVSYQNSKIEMIDIETGQVIQEFDSAQTYDNTPNTQISCIMAHPTIHTLVSGHEDKYIRFYDINSGKCNHSMVAHLDAISSLDVSNNGLSIVSGGHDASIRWWDLTNHSCVQEFSAHRSKTSEAVCGVKFHRTYPWLASCGADSGIKMYTCN